MKAIKFRSKKSLQKRFKVSATGVFKCHHAGNAHLASHKSNQRKKRLRDSFLLSKNDISRLKKVMGLKMIKKNINSLPKITPEAKVLPV